MFVYGHVARALHDRLARKTTVEQSDLQLVPPYHVAAPAFIRTKIGTLGAETEKSTAVTVIWYLGADRAEVIDGTTGTFFDEPMLVGLIFSILWCQNILLIYRYFMICL